MGWGEMGWDVESPLLRYIRIIHRNSLYRNHIPHKGRGRVVGISTRERWEVPLIEAPRAEVGMGMMSLPTT